MRIPILGGLGGLRSGGEKLGSGQGHHSLIDDYNQQVRSAGRRS